MFSSFSLEKWLRGRTDANADLWLRFAVDRTGHVAVSDGQLTIRGRTVKDACISFAHCWLPKSTTGPERRIEAQASEDLLFGHAGPDEEETVPAAKEGMEFSGRRGGSLSLARGPQDVEVTQERTVTFKVRADVYDRAQEFVSVVGLSLEDALPAILEMNMMGAAAGTLPDPEAAAESPLFRSMFNRAQRRAMRRKGQG